MAFKQGEVYRCPDAECACEVTVTKSAAPGKGGNSNPRCCCGKEMVKKWWLGTELPANLRPERPAEVCGQHE